MKHWLSALALAISFSAFGASVAPNRGGINDGPPAIDTASDGTKNGTFSLNYNKSSCLKLVIGKPRHIPDEDSPPGADNSLWIENTCSIPIEFAFCSIGNVDDGFNCTPDSKSVLAPQVAYQTGEWQLEARGATPLGTGRGNRVVWYACDWSQKKAPLPLLTSFNPPMGVCWESTSNDSSSPDAFRNRQGSASRNGKADTQGTSPDSARNANGTPRGRVLGERSAGGSVDGSNDPPPVPPDPVTGNYPCKDAYVEYCEAMRYRDPATLTPQFCMNHITRSMADKSSSPNLLNAELAQDRQNLGAFERGEVTYRNAQREGLIMRGLVRSEECTLQNRDQIQALFGQKAGTPTPPRPSPQVVQSHQQRASLSRAGTTLQPVTLKMLMNPDMQNPAAAPPPMLSTADTRNQELAFIDATDRLWSSLGQPRIGERTADQAADKMALAPIANRIAAYELCPQCKLRAVLFCNKQIKISTPGNLSGLRISSNAAFIEAGLNRLGASAMTRPPLEAVDQLRNGSLDCIAILENKNGTVTPSRANSSPQPAITNTPSEAVQDLKTGLSWKRCFEGQTLSGGGCSGDPGRYNYSEAKQLEKDGWRLPTLDEIYALTPTLLDRARLPDGRTLDYIPSSQLTDNGVGWYSGRIGGNGWIGGMPTAKRAIRLVRANAPADAAAPAQATTAAVSDSASQPAANDLSALAVLFDAGSSGLTIDAMRKLDAMAARLPGVAIEVIIAVGYSDASDRGASAFALSTQRAEAVKAYLVNKGVDANRVYTEGKGILKKAGTPAGNRRVEIEIVAARNR